MIRTLRTMLSWNIICLSAVIVFASSLHGQIIINFTDNGNGTTTMSWNGKFSESFTLNVSTYGTKTFNNFSGTTVRGGTSGPTYYRNVQITTDAGNGAVGLYGQSLSLNLTGTNVTGGLFGFNGISGNDSLGELYYGSGSSTSTITGSMVIGSSLSSLGLFSHS